MPEADKIIYKNAIRFKIGGICLSFDIKDPGMREMVARHYRNFISRQEPDIDIKVRYANFAKPLPKSIILKGERWQLGKERGRLFFYFAMRDFPAIAWLSSDFKKIRLYLYHRYVDLLFHLFPSLLFGLRMPQDDGLMLHACGVTDGKAGCLFVAPSGGGKSTLASLAIKSGRKVLNDDRIIIRRDKAGFKIYGSPWSGKAGIGLNKFCRIHNLFFLQKSENNRIKAIGGAEAARRLFENSIYLPANNDIIKKVFALCCDIAGGLKCAKLSFKVDKSIWSLLDGNLK